MTGPSLLRYQVCGNPVELAVRDAALLEPLGALFLMASAPLWTVARGVVRAGLLPS
jgi:hypothetical protein